MKKFVILCFAVYLSVLGVFAQPAVTSEAVATPAATVPQTTTPAAAADPAPTPYVIPQTGTTVTILFTSDMHGHFQRNAANGTLGYSGIDAIKRSIPGSILVEGGDYLTSNMFMTEDTINDVLSLMNAVGYHVAGIGEADLENGAETLQFVQSEAAFHMLSSNVTYSKERYPLLGSTQIVEMNGIRVGFFSILNPDLRLDVSLQNLQGVYLEDASKTAQKCVNSLKNEGADIIVALSHIGSKGDINVDQVAAFVNGIDFILDGHDHQEEGGRWIGDTLILNPGANGKQMVELKLTFDAYKKLTSLETSLWSYEAIKDLPLDEGVVALEDSIAQRQAEFLGADVAKAEVDIPYSAAMRYQSEPLGNFIADAYRMKTMATVAIVNAGSIEAGIPAGEVTKGTILSVLPNQYTVQVKNVTPKMLKTALEGCIYNIKVREDGTIDTSTATAEFPQISGFTAQINFNNEPGKRVMGIRLDSGVDLNLTDTYNYISLASSSGVFSGEFGYDIFLTQPVESEYGSEGQALLEHLARTENPEDFRDARITLTNQQESYTGLIISILLVIMLVVMVLIFIIKLITRG